jgi:hypothetical protein
VDNYKLDQNELTFGENEIKWSNGNVVDYLGVKIDGDLSFVDQMEEVFHKMNKRKFIIDNHCNFQTGVNPKTLMLHFDAYIRSIIMYGSQLWIFKLRGNFSEEFHWSSKINKPYKQTWKKINKLYLQLLKKVVGVQKSTSGNAILVRAGELTLDYHVAYYSLILFLKIKNGNETLLKLQYETEIEDDEKWSNSLFFRPAQVMLERLGRIVNEDLLTLNHNEAKPKILRAMTYELAEMWYLDGMSFFTKRIYPMWNLAKLNGMMLSKFTTSLYHQLAVGRCPLRGRRFDLGYEDHDTCRFGCASRETPEHIFIKCKFLQQSQIDIREACNDIDVPYSLKSILTEHNLKILVEKLLIKVFTGHKVWEG